jgi:uncharacterized membrane protein
MSAIGLTRASDPPVSSNKTTQKCPVMTDQDIDPDIYVDYKGTRVYFCCPRCRGKFKRDPEKYFKLIAQTDPAVGSTPLVVGSTPKSDASGGLVGEKATESPLESVWLVRLGRFHPAMTDLPIGALFAALTAELLFMRRRQPMFDHAARFCIWFAAITAVFTVPLGWCLGGFHPGTDDKLLGIHRWLGTASLLLLLMVLWTSESARRSSVESPGAWKRYRMLLFGGTLCIAVTAFFGGAMVWGLDHYWK